MSDDQPIAILVRGLPGSGKTYFAERLAAALGQEKVVMLDPDSIDKDSPEYQQHVKTQEKEGVDPSLHLYRFSRAKAYQGIEEGKIIIWNQPFSNLEIFNKMVDRLREHAKTHDKDLKVLVAEVELDPAVAKARIESRKRQGGHGPSDNTFGRFINDHKSFAGEGYQTVSIHGEADVNDSVSKVIKVLGQLS